MSGINVVCSPSKKSFRLLVLVVIMVNVLVYFYYAEVVSYGVVHFVKYSRAVATVERNDMDLPTCKLKRTELRDNVSPEKRLDEVDRNSSILRLVRPGGAYSPPNCKPNSTVAIIVPFRDRSEHRVLFLHHMHSFLQKQQISYRIFIVELTDRSQFNRALLMNAGFLYAANITNFSCYIFHDIDLLPTNEFNIYSCSDVMHFASNNSKYGYRLLYKTYFGGVVGFSEKAFRSINGCSNLFYGWGKEDDDLYKRVLKKVPKMFNRAPLDVGVYQALEHEKSASDTKIYLSRSKLSISYSARLEKDGLNSINVSYVTVENRDLYTWLLVDVDEEFEVKAKVRKMCRFQYVLKLIDMLLVINFLNNAPKLPKSS